jgi:hypothetical protein
MNHPDSVAQTWLEAVADRVGTLGKCSRRGLEAERLQNEPACVFQAAAELPPGRVEGGLDKPVIRKRGSKTVIQLA